MEANKREIDLLIEFLNTNAVSEESKVVEAYPSWIVQPVYADTLEITKDIEHIDFPAVRGAFTIFYVLEGKVRVITSTKEEEVTVNDGVGVVNHKAYKLANIGGMAKINILIFNISAIFSYGTEMLSIKYRNPFLTDDGDGFDVFDSKSPFGNKICSNIDELIRLKKEQTYGYELAIKARLCDIWYMIVNSFFAYISNCANSTHKNDEVRIKQAVEYISAHYKEQITLDNIADELHICKSECCRLFKRTMNITPIDYVIRYRINAVTTVLDSAEVEIAAMSDIAAGAGFNNVSYFNKMFKKQLGMTPKEYRAAVMESSLKK